MSYGIRVLLIALSVSLFSGAFAVPEPPPSLLPVAGELQEAFERDRVYYEEELIPFLRKVLIDSFDERRVVADQRADVRRVREMLVTYFTWERVNFSAQTELGELARVLYKKGCRDPAVLVAWCIDAEEYETPGYPVAVAMRSAMARACKSEEDILLNVMCAHHCVRVARKWQKNGDTEKLARAYLKDALEEAKSILMAAPPRFVVALMHEPACSEAFKEDYDPYIYACLRARDLMDTAFEARGTGWAGSVTEEGWEGWETNNEKARKALAIAHRLRPEWPESMILRASLEGRNGTMRQQLAWMQKAILTSPASARYMYSISHYLTSRWGGSTEVLKQLAMDAVDSRAVQSMMPYFALEAALGAIVVYEIRAFDDLRRMDRTLYDPLFCAKIYTMVDAYLEPGARPDFFPSDNFFATLGLTAAVCGHDWEAARKYRAKFKPPYTSGEFYFALSATPRHTHKAIGRLIRTIAQSPRGERFIQAEEALDAGRYEEAFARYDAIEKEGSLSEDEAGTLDYRRLCLRILVGERDGTPIDLRLGKTGDDAEFVYARAYRGEDGKVYSHGYSLANQKILLPYVGKVFEGRIHFLPSEEARSKYRSIIWALTHPPTLLLEYGALKFTRKDDGTEVCQIIPACNKVSHAHIVPLKPADSHTFAFAVDKQHKPYLWLDGEPVDLSPIADDLMMAIFKESHNGIVQPMWEFLSGPVAYDNYTMRPFDRDEFPTLQTSHSTNSTNGDKQ